MKVTTLIILLVLSSSYAPADSVWWNANQTEIIDAPKSIIIEGGDSVYGNLETGETKRASEVGPGGSLGPGKWVMIVNPMEFTIINSYSAGPKWKIWDERLYFKEEKLNWFIRHEIETLANIEAWVDNGGGKKRVYKTLQKISLINENGGEFPMFEENFIIIYEGNLPPPPLLSQQAQEVRPERLRVTTWGHIKNRW